MGFGDTSRIRLLYLYSTVASNSTAHLQYSSSTVVTDIYMHEVISERHKKESIINGRWRGARCCCAVVFPDSQIPRFPDLVRESLDG